MKNVQDKSIVRRFFLLSIVFGISMGAVFPIYAQFFVKNWESKTMEYLFVIGCIFAGVFVGLFSYMIFRYTILKIIKDVAMQMEKIAQKDGDLTIRLDCSSKDEIGELAFGFNHFVEKIFSVVKESSDLSQQIAIASSEISSTTTVLSDAAQGQAMASDNIYETIHKVANAVESTATSCTLQSMSLKRLTDRMDELTGIIDQISNKVNETLSLSQLMTNESKEGDQALEIMTKSMNKIRNSSSEMVNIIAIINDISDKINLLSLNAAIEAARAGEQGRGFAVVADEISKLADQTAGSLKDIEKLIVENNNEIAVGIESSSKTVKIIGKISLNVLNVENMMKEIFESTQQGVGINDSVDEEATTVQQLSDNIKQATEAGGKVFLDISDLISEIRDHTRNNAATSEELSGSSESLDFIAKTLAEKMEFFKVK